MPSRQSQEAQYNLTTEDVAERYGLAPWAVRRMVRMGKIHAINIGTERRRILRFCLGDLRRFELSRAASSLSRSFMW